MQGPSDRSSINNNKPQTVLCPWSCAVCRLLDLQPEAGHDRCNMLNQPAHPRKRAAKQVHSMKYIGSARINK